MAKATYRRKKEFIWGLTIPEAESTIMAGNIAAGRHAGIALEQ